MISLIVALPVGNALRVFMSPPASAVRWRLLRKTSGTFAGADDPDAYLVMDGTLTSVLDKESLMNGFAYFYQLYSWDGASWSASGPAVSKAPASTIDDGCVDVLSLVRERLQFALAVDVSAGRLSHETGQVPVFTAPPVFDDTRFPIVTVHLASDSPSERFIGETLFADEIDGSGDWAESEGWLSSVQLTIMGWSINPDERIALRQALKRAVIGNLPVFDDAGMINIDFQQQDTEDFESYGAPVYQVMCSLNCLAPSVISAPEPNQVSDLSVTASTAPAATP